MSVTHQSPSRINRRFTAIDRNLAETLNRIAREATVINRGYNVTQRQVHDTLLWYAIQAMGEEGAAQLTFEAVHNARGAD
jgi:hypothetical protein